jgi:hypothetical protein
MYKVATRMGAFLRKSKELLALLRHADGLAARIYFFHAIRRYRQLGYRFRNADPIALFSIHNF